VIRNIEVGTKPDGAIRDPKSGEVIVMDGTRDEAIFVDPDKGKVLARIKVEGEPGSPVLDGRGHLLFNVTSKSETLLVDLATRKVLKRFALPDCEDASPLALDRARDVLLTGCANLKAVALDPRTGRIFGTAAIGKYPDVIMFDEQRGVFYVPTVIPGTLTVVGIGPGGAPQALANLPVAFGVHTGALDAPAGRLYLPAGDLKLVHGQRPAVAPGTFKIMVIDVSGGPPGASR
jgi:DNA-binding beta-propeller fold protein YncE